MARQQESDHERSLRLRRLGRKGKKGLGASIVALRATMPTDDLLESLTATYPPLDAATLQAMTRVGAIGAPDWILEEGDIPEVLLLMGIAVVRHVALLIGRGRFERRRVALIGGSVETLDDIRKDIVRGQWPSAKPIATTSGRVAAYEAVTVAQATVTRLLDISTPWGRRLKRCPTPGCDRPYFWDMHDRAIKKYHDPACQKAHSRLSASDASQAPRTPA
jgi:hypothetical protein